MAEAVPRSRPNGIERPGTPSLVARASLPKLRTSGVRGSVGADDGSPEAVPWFRLRNQGSGDALTRRSCVPTEAFCFQHLITASLKTVASNIRRTAWPGRSPCKSEEVLPGPNGCGHRQEEKERPKASPRPTAGARHRPPPARSPCAPSTPTPKARAAEPEPGIEVPRHDRFRSAWTRRIKGAHPTQRDDPRSHRTLTSIPQENRLHYPSAPNP